MSSSSDTDSNGDPCRLCSTSSLTSAGDMLLEAGGIRAHFFCLMFSSGLGQSGLEDEGLRGFMPVEIRKEIKRGARLKCVYCKQKGATVGCAKPQCKKSYHLPCGLKHNSLQQYYDQFKSFCCTHRPHQRKAQRKTRTTECTICREELEGKPTVGVIASPCCSGFFHRSCLQNQALCAGAYHFRCPLCNDSSRFVSEMLHMGLYVPQRDAQWEQSGAFDDLYRGLTCQAKVCFCDRPASRECNETDGLWEILGCYGCGSCGIHVKCGGMDEYVDPEWHCYTCRRIVKPDDGKSRLKPIKEIWGRASAKKINSSPDSSLTITKSPSVDSPDSSLKTHSLSVPIVRRPPPSNFMNVTLEDLIVAGLSSNRKVETPKRSAEDAVGSSESPGDSDYESSPTEKQGRLPFKVRKLHHHQEGKQDAQVLKTNIQRSITDYFKEN